MIYKEFQGLKLSALGFGAMRLPLTNKEDNSSIDEEKAAEMVACAFDQGVNYFDTAYGYHIGQSEIVLGKILSKYPRESFYLASKFPGYDRKNLERAEEIFEEQLKKCGVEYFDFYLFHNVYEKNIDGYLDPQYGLLDYLLKQKEAGRIKHLGFSTHGRYHTMKRFLDAYGKDMEFCQIQLNYLDWSLQDAKRKIELLNEYHLPVWVMEPVRGGKLAKLKEEDANTLKALRPEESIPAWAFRFLQTIPEVTMILSGMSNLEQVQDNLHTFSENKPLNEKEMAALMKIADEWMDCLPCTACGYCLDYCTKSLEIPLLLEMYNELRFANDADSRMALEILAPEKRPESCVGCKKCEEVCPQQIKISEVMKDFVKRLAE